MIKIYEICVSITKYLLQQINIRWRNKNIQHSMLARPDFNDVSIKNYKREKFRHLCYQMVYITHSLN